LQVEVTEKENGILEHNRYRRELFVRHASELNVELDVVQIIIVSNDSQGSQFGVMPNEPIETLTSVINRLVCFHGFPILVSSYGS